MSRFAASASVPNEGEPLAVLADDALAAAPVAAVLVVARARGANDGVGALGALDAIGALAELAGLCELVGRGEVTVRGAAECAGFTATSALATGCVVVDSVATVTSGATLRVASFAIVSSAREVPGCCCVLVDAPVMSEISYNS